MDPQELISLARQLVAGTISPDEFARDAAHILQRPAGDTAAMLAAATVDLDRRRRCGFPEVVFGPGKTIDQLREIIALLVQYREPVLATRIDAVQAVGLLEAFPVGRYNPVARTFRLQTAPAPTGERLKDLRAQPFVAVISAGTGDLPVAEEARETLDWMGVHVVMIHDVGVAGPHRLPQRVNEFQHADAVVVVAGMEGALPSVVGGYVACPVIAVPTSIGYGANFGGVSALLSMLNSCASNVAVVTIDAGFKGGYLAGLIATRMHQPSSVGIQAR
jgi:pyridinium-3,5-biscarboxylic acid mononucleotide synthase